MGIWNSLSRASAARGRRARRQRKETTKTVKARQLRIERFEDRLLLSIAPTGGPILTAILPNAGSDITPGTILNVAPQQLTFTFNQGEVIDNATIGAIHITRTDSFGNTTVVTPGYIARADEPNPNNTAAPNQNEVIVRFAQTLLSGTYTISIDSTLKDSKGKAFDAPQALGAELPLNFQLDLGAMVTSVVPQPVTRTASGALQQSRNEVDVYFSEKLAPVSAENPQLYQLIATNDTADTSDDSAPLSPVSVVYNAVANEAALYFFQNGPNYTDPTMDLNTLAPTGTHGLRLRVGSFNQPIVTASVSVPSGAAGMTYATALPVQVPGAASSFGSVPQSIVLADQIQATAYTLQWPGGPADPGNRQLPDEPDVIDNEHFSGGTYDATGIQHYTYWFPTTYGLDSNGYPANNVITAAQKQRTREIFQLLSYYCGVQFEEAAPGQTGDLAIITGDLYPEGAQSGQGIVVVPDPVNHRVVVDSDQNWGTSPFGGAWMHTAMEGIMDVLGAGVGDDLPASQIMNETNDAITNTDSEQLWPGQEDLDTLLRLFRPDSTDYHMYSFTVTTPGTFSAETIAARLAAPSLLNTELRIFQQNADGTYAPIAQNDNYFGSDSFVSLSLQPGKYFVGVSASGNDQYDPNLPDSGMGGTTEGNYDLRLNFVPQATGPAQSLPDGNGILLTGASVVVNPGTTPFAAGQYFGQTALTGIDIAHVPNVAALDGTTFSVALGTTTFTFQFVDGANPSSQAAAGNMAVDFNSATDNIGTVRQDMVTAINQVITHLVGLDGVLFDGDADGTPGGTYDYWFNVAGASDNTLIVDKSAAAGGSGTLAKPYNTLSTALATASAAAAAGKHDIVRVEGNAGGIALIDGNGNDITGRDLSSGETFSIGDGILNVPVTFEFLNASLSPKPVPATGDVPVYYLPTDTAATLVQEIAAAINAPISGSVTYPLKVRAVTKTTDATIPDARMIRLNPVGTSTPLFWAGTMSSSPAGTPWLTNLSPLGSSMLNTQAYEIGTTTLVPTLPDGATMQVPQNTTVMIDAGAVFKLAGANIDVGSLTQGVDHSGGALQVLGRPQQSVYFTSYQDATVGKNDSKSAAAPKRGDWGGLVFRSDLDHAYNQATPAPATPRFDAEAQGMFLNYVNNAVISYGGGSVSDVGGVGVYDPIYMAQTRVTATYNTITSSNDAALSADPNTFLESKFEGNAGSLYTADYDRVGPELYGNHITGNSINGLLVRIRTSAGSSLDQLTVPARFNARDLTYVIAENLEIQGNPGGPLLTAPGTSHLQLAGANEIQAVDGQTIGDGDTFSVSDGVSTMPLELDTVSLSVLQGGTPPAQANGAFFEGETLTVTDPNDAAMDATFYFDDTGYTGYMGYSGYIEFLPTDTPGDMAQHIVNAINSFYTTTFAKGTTNFSYSHSGSQLSITQIDMAHMPVDQDAFTITEGASSATFTLIDTSIPGNTATGPYQIAFDSTAPNVNTLLTNMVTAINDADIGVTATAGNGSIALTGTTLLSAAELPYGGEIDGLTNPVPATVALSGFNQTTTIQVTPALTPVVDTVMPLVVVGQPGVTAGSYAIPATVADSASTVAARTATAIDNASLVLGNTLSNSLNPIAEGDNFTLTGPTGTATYTYTFDATKIGPNYIMLTAGSSAATVMNLTLRAIDIGATGVKPYGVVIGNVSRITFPNATQALTVQSAQGGVIAESLFPSVLTTGNALTGNASLLGEGDAFTVTGPQGTATYTYTYSATNSFGYTNPILLKAGNNASTVLTATLNAINSDARPERAGAYGVVAANQSRITLANVTALTASAATGNLLVQAADGLTATANGSLVSLSLAGSGTVALGGLTVVQARQSASLVVDPGVVVKLNGARIETQIGAQLIAEGTAGNPVVFTSTEDDRYGGGGSFDTTGDGYSTAVTAANAPHPGDWGGLNFLPTATGSIDQAVIAYAGGVTRIEGGFASFNAIEIIQAKVRVADSIIEHNADGSGTDTDPEGDRSGRETNVPATIFVRGAQPVIVDNLIQYNELDTTHGGSGTGALFDSAPAISIDVDSLTSVNVPDWGRATGLLNAFTQYNDNDGPLVRGNRLGDNGENGMEVRAGTLSTQSVWDDTDIVHIVTGEIVSTNQDTYGGVRLQSSDQASLVVKLLGATAGFTATGTPLETTDTIGGTVQVIGRPGYPVVLTSLRDNSVGAGLDPSGQPQDDTLDANDPANPNFVPAAAPGDWQSILLDTYSNDRNVAEVHELEPASGVAADENATTAQAQALGQLAPNINSGDDNSRLGFEVQGSIRSDAPDDTDTYSFQGTGGTEVWLAMERTSFALDSVMEVVDANGNLIARSDNMQEEASDPSLLGGAAQPLQNNPFTSTDDYSDNIYDPGMSLILPGTTGQVQTYYVRVYSALGIGDVDVNHLPAGISSISTANIPVGIQGITAAAVADGEQFQVQDGAGNTVAFEFVDTTKTTMTAPAAHVTPIFFTPGDTAATLQAEITAAISGYVDVGHFATLATGNEVIQNINAASVPSVALLDGAQFTLQVGAKATTFEFVDKSVRSQALYGHVAIFFDSSLPTTTLAVIRTDMAAAINGAAIGVTAQVLGSGDIALHGASVTFLPDTSGFTGQATFAGLDGDTFKVTDGAGNAATFEFVDTSMRSAARPGHVAVFFDSTSTTDLRPALATAINGSGLACTAHALADGTLALYGTGVVFDAGALPLTVTAKLPLNCTPVALPDGTIALQGSGVTFAQGTPATPFTTEKNLENLDSATFQVSDGSNQTTTYEFVDTSNPARFAALGHTGVYFNSATLATLPTAAALGWIDAAIISAVNGYVAIGGVDATYVPTLAALDGETFQITDSSNNTLTFEFVDTSKHLTASGTNVAIDFNSTASGATMTTVRAAMVAAINGSGLSCIAQALPDDSVALFGPGGVKPTLTLATAAPTPFTAVNPTGATTYAARAVGGSIALQGSGVQFDAGSTNFYSAVNGDVVIDGIDASHVPNLAKLDGTTFQITDAAKVTTTFEFIDVKGTTTLPAGCVKIGYDSTGTLAAVRTALAAAVNGLGLACSAQVLPDGSVALYGPNGVRPTLNLATATPTPFAQVVVPQNLENLDGAVFQITDGAGKTLTFELVDSLFRTQAAAGHLPVFFNSTTSTIADIRTAIAVAINGYVALDSADATITGITGHNLSLIASGETFQITDGAGTTVTFQFVDTSKGKPVTAGNVAVDFTAAGLSVAAIRSAVVAAINGVNFGCSAQAMPDGTVALFGANLVLNLSTATPTPFATQSVLTGLDKTTFAITNQAGQTVTFEFVDTTKPGRVVGAGHVAVDFTPTESADAVRAAMAAAINASVLKITASVLSDGTIALRGTNLLVNPGTAAVFLTTPVSYTFGCTAEVRPSGAISIYGAKAVLDTGTTSFSLIGRTSGVYQLQVRLQATAEIPGSTVQYADIRYAANGIDIKGKPNDSPLTTTTAQVTANGVATNTTFATAEDIGNLLDADQGTLTVSANFDATTDVNWYKFELSYQDIATPALTFSSIPTIFDVNWASGLARPDLVLYVFDSTGKLIYTADNSNIADNTPDTSSGTDPADPSRASIGAGDPYLGPVALDEAPANAVSPTGIYYVAVAKKTVTADALMQSMQPQTKQEPIDSITRVVEDHIDSTDGSEISNNATQTLTVSPVAFTLSDVTMYANTTTGLYTEDPFTGEGETDVCYQPGSGANDHLPYVNNKSPYNDITMRDDGGLYTVVGNTSGQETYEQLDTGDARNPVSQTILNLQTYTNGGSKLNEVTGGGGGVTFQALANSHIANSNTRFTFAVGSFSGIQIPNEKDPVPPGPAFLNTTNLLYVFNGDGTPVLYPDNIPDETTATKADAGPQLGTNLVPIGQLDTTVAGGAGGRITGLAIIGDVMYAVDDKGGLYEVVASGSGAAWDPGNGPDPGFEKGGGGGLWGFVPWDNTATAKPDDVHSWQLSDSPEAPALLPIATLTDNTGTAIKFSGLTAGPPDVENGNYANTLFATDSNGEIYALDPTTGSFQPVFLDGNTSTALINPISGATLANVTGLAFSPIDYNLWHLSDGLANSAGHGINPAPDDSRTTQMGYPQKGDESYYFGLENPNTSAEAQPDAGNFANQNSYDVPGGAHGSLETSPFSLVGYTAQDCPTLYFNYFLDAGGPNYFDTARVFASTDNVTWTQLTNNVTWTQLPDGSNPPVTNYDLTGLNSTVAANNGVGTNSGWMQAIMNLGAMAGSSNVRLRFDFTTAGDMNVGDEYYAGEPPIDGYDSGMTTGAYMSAVPGDQIQDGQYLAVSNDQVSLLTYTPNTNFEFDLGAVLDVPGTSGLALPKGQTFTITDGLGNATTFQIIAAGSQVTDPTYVGIPINDADTPAEIVTAISTAINTQIAAGTLNVQVLTYQNRVEIIDPGWDTSTAAQLTVTAPTSTPGGITLEGDGPGVAAGTPFQPTVRVPISFADSDLTVASTLVGVMNATLNSTTLTPSPNAVTDPGAGSSVVQDLTYPQVMHMIGHYLTLQGASYGPLPYSNVLPGDNPPLEPYDPPIISRYHVFQAGQDNDHQGFYVDDLIVGFAERGNMVTGDTADTNFTPVAPRSVDIITTGSYTLQIRQAPQYGTVFYGVAGNTSKNRELDLESQYYDYGTSFDTNDRMTNGLTLTVPADVIDATTGAVTATAGTLVQSGETFSVSDGTKTLTFEYLPKGLPADTGVVPIYITGVETQVQLAALVTAAINAQTAAGNLHVTAVTNGAGNRIDLNGASWIGNVTFAAVAGAQLTDGQAFSVFDGFRSTTFTFWDSTDDPASRPANAVPFTAADSLATVAANIALAINAAGIDVAAVATSYGYVNLGGLATGVNLSGQTVRKNVNGLVEDVTLDGNLNDTTVGPYGTVENNSVSMADFAVQTQPVFDLGTSVLTQVTPVGIDMYSNGSAAVPGDVITPRVQGETIINADKITYSQNYGIVIEPGDRSATNAPIPGAINPLDQVNVQGTVGGVTIENNVVAFGGVGGIHISGDANPADQPVAAEPFFRIVNNTIYGGSVGASQINEIISDQAGNLYTLDLTTDTLQYIGTTGLQLLDDAASPAGTLYGTAADVLGTTLYQINASLTGGPGAVTTTPIGAMQTAAGDDLWLNALEFRQDGQLFGAGMDETTGTFGIYQLDPATGIGTLLISTGMEQPAGDLAFDANNNVYMTCVSGDLLRVDAGFTTLVNLGNTGFPDFYGLSYAPGTTMYGLRGDGELYSIDPATAAATYVTTLFDPHLSPLTPISGGATFINPVLLPAGTGITVDNNASPTILNNIIANEQEGVVVDASSASTVLGTTLYQNITDPAINQGIGLGSFPLAVAAGVPLFVDAAAGNFYLAEGSPAIDSSMNSLPDRTGMVAVESAIGLPPSPIIAPAYDMLGQLRAADPLNTTTPISGLGQNPYIDRGAIDRVDFTGPSARLGLIEPPTDDASDVAPTWVSNDFTVISHNVPVFAIQLQDQDGAGVDNTSVSESDVTVTRSDGTPLTAGVDYTYTYDANTNTIYLASTSAYWANGYTYTVQLTNTATGIKDIAGNDLQANRSDGTTKFNITLMGFLEYSHAPNYPIAWHTLGQNIYLGSTPPVPETAFVPSISNSNDNGVVFGNAYLMPGQDVALAITVTNTTGSTAYLDAWIDFNGDKVFEDSERLTFFDGVTDPGTLIPVSTKDPTTGFPVTALKLGLNSLVFQMPASATAGLTFARFRLSTTPIVSAGESTPGAGDGGAINGEVEDYQVTIVPDAAITRADATPTNLAQLHYTVTFSEPVTGVDISDFVPVQAGGLNSAFVVSVAPANGSYSTYNTVYTVIVDTGVGNGTLGLNLVDDNSIKDAALNPLGGPALGDGNVTGPVYTIDKIVPLVQSINTADANPSHAASVHYTVTFTKPVAGVDPTDFTLVTTPAAINPLTNVSITSVAAVAPVAGFASVYIVTVSTGAGDGTLQLNLIDDDSIVDVAGNTLGGPGMGNGNATGQVYTIRKTPPVVTQITTPNPNPTNAATVTYVVTLNEPVTGVAIGDFALATTGTITGAAITLVTPAAGPANTYTVTVSTGGGDGTIGLNVVDNDSILDAAGNPLGGVGLGNGNYTGPIYIVRKTAPVVASIVPAGANPSNAAQVLYTVTFSERVSGVALKDFTTSSPTITGASVLSFTPTGPGFSATYTVTVGTGLGDGLLSLNVVDDDSIADQAGNLLGGPGAGNGNFTTGLPYTIDKTPPVVQSIVKADKDPNNSAAVHYTVTFSEPVSGVDASDFALVASGLTGTGVTVVSPTTGLNTVYTVTVNTGSGDGTLQLNLVENDPIADAATNPLGGPGSPGNNAFSGPTYTIRKTPPVVTSIVKAGRDPSNAVTVNYTVTFSEPVTNVVSSDFIPVTAAPTSLTGVFVAGVTPGGNGYNTTYTVTVNTGSGDGTLGLNLLSDATIVDQAGNLLNTSATIAPDQAYTIRKTLPVVTAITKPDKDPTNATTVHYTVAFSEPVSGVDASDFALVANGLTSTSVTAVSPTSGLNSVYTVTVNTGFGDGTLQLNLVENDPITDAATNLLGGPGSPGNAPFSGPAYTVRKTPPVVQSITLVGANPTNAAQVLYTVTFSEPVTGVAASNFSAASTTITGAAAVSVAPTGTGPYYAVYTVTMGTGSGDGTLALNIVNDATIADQAGNLLNGSATISPDQAYTIRKTPPAVATIVKADKDPTNVQTVHFTVVFSEPVTGVDPTDFVLVAPALTTPTVTAVSPTGSGYVTSYTVTVDTGTGTGSLGLNVVEKDPIADQAGNLLGGPGSPGNGAFTGPAYTIDRTPPVVSTITKRDPDPTNAALVHFAVTFSKPVTGVDPTDFTVTAPGLSGYSVTSVSPSITSLTTSFIVTVATGTGDGSLQLNLVDDDSIKDAVGNPLGGVGAGNGNFAGPAYTVLKSAPVVASIVKSDKDPTNATSVHFAVNFSRAVLGVDPTDFTIVSTGLTGAVVTTVTPSVTTLGTSFVVTASTGTGDGTLQLKLVDNNSIKDAAGNLLGGPLFGDGNFTGPTYTVRKTPPTATITSASTANPVITTPIAFKVVFSEAVTNFTAANVAFTGSTAPGRLAATISGSGTTYTVYVSGMTDNGTVVVRLNAGAAVDAAGNLSVASGAASVNYNKFPTFTITPAVGQATPTNHAPEVFTVTFNQPVVDMTAAKLVFTGSTAPGKLAATVSGAGTTYTVSVTGMTGTGRVTINVPANAVHSALNNGNKAYTGTTNSVFYDIDAPTALLINPAAKASVTDATLNAQKYLDIGYATNVGAGLYAAALAGTPTFTLTGAGAANVKINWTPTHQTSQQAGVDIYRYAFSGAFAAGTISVNFLANTFRDNAGNWNKAAVFTFTVTHAAAAKAALAAPAAAIAAAAPGVASSSIIVGPLQSTNLKVAIPAAPAASVVPGAIQSAAAAADSALLLDLAAAAKGGASSAGKATQKTSAVDAVLGSAKFQWIP